MPTDRFIIIENYALNVNYSHAVFLIDFAFWARHELDLRVWCDDNDAKFAGMMVEIPNAPTLTAFCLKWNGPTN